MKRTTFTPLAASGRTEPLKIAHRGASAYAPENSLLAFEKAAELGADMVEVDLRVTLDNRPVIAHDESLKRLYNVDATIDSLKLAKLQQTTRSRGQVIPTFEQVAAVCAEYKLGLYLDIKQLNLAAMKRVYDNLLAYELLPVTIAGSFRPDYVAEIKAHWPDLKTSILFGSVHIDPVALAGAVRADYVHPCWENAAPEPHRLLTPDWLARVRAKGLGVICWHEERLAEIAALKALGVDGICSDQPDLL
jgi:glycerophosphoryl diester phosphodiesterase